MHRVYGWLVRAIILLYNVIICCVCPTVHAPLGGSLDSYGNIPEEVLGRVAVAVS